MTEARKSSDSAQHYLSAAHVNSVKCLNGVSYCFLAQGPAHVVVVSLSVLKSTTATVPQLLKGLAQLLSLSGKWKQ